MLSLVSLFPVWGVVTSGIYLVPLTSFTKFRGLITVLVTNGDYERRDSKLAVFMVR